jgi:hypothetical protein
MVRDPLGLFIWPEDVNGPDVYSGMLLEGHYVLYGDSYPNKIWDNKPFVEDNEFCISPLCMVKWND